jgi:hypothetical protein
MFGRVGDSLGQIGEDVMLGEDAFKCADAGEQSGGLWTCALEQDGDATVAELAQDLAQCSRSRRIEHGQ